MDELGNYNRYSEQSRKYLENARKFLEEEDLDKASEFLWGAVAEAVKAVAAKRGLILRSHRELWEFIRELSTELNDPMLYEDFRTANYLHSNFYEVELGVHEVLSATERIERLLSRLTEIADMIE